MKYIKIILSCIIVMNVAVSYGQKNYTQEADVAFDGEGYYKAIDLYKKAYTKEKSKEKKAEILFRIAESYRLIQDPTQAETWYIKSIKAKYPDPIANFHLAEVLKAQAKYDEALTEYNNYKSAKPDDSRGDNGVKSCTLAQEWKDNPSRYEVQNEVLLNSKQYDFSSTFSNKKNNEIIFTSTREGATGTEPDARTGENFSDLWTATRDKKGKWSVPSLLNETVNSASNEGSATLNGKYNMIYFTRCEYAKNKTFGCQIFQAPKAGNNWGEATVMSLGVDTITFGHPSLSADDKFLFFASDLVGGQGGKDIWYVKYDDRTKAWSEPVNAGADVNTPGDEMFPYVHADNTLYFASDGHPGMGGLDIFKAASTGSEKWGKVENMKYPINSEANDFGIIFEGNQDKGYFTSNRPGGKGGDDIYSFFMPPLVFALQGNVTNLDNQSAIDGANVKLVGSDGNTYESVTDATGFYSFDAIPNSRDRYINSNTSYQIIINKDTYLNAKGEETTVGVEKSTTFVHDFALQPTIDETTGEKKEIKFPEVLYDLGSYTLRPESKDSLNFLFQVLIDNPTIVIELSAHTDSRGSNRFNKKLSEQRANACIDYMIEKGIVSERLVPKGYGEDRLLFTDDEIYKLKTKEEQEAQHQKNRRTVFSVLRDDYVPPSSEGEEDGGSQ